MPYVKCYAHFFPELYPPWSSKRGAPGGGRGRAGTGVERRGSPSRTTRGSSRAAGAACMLAMLAAARRGSLVGRGRRGALTLARGRPRHRHPSAGAFDIAQPLPCLFVTWISFCNPRPSPIRRRAAVGAESSRPVTHVFLQQGSRGSATRYAASHSRPRSAAPRRAARPPGRVGK